MGFNEGETCIISPREFCAALGVEYSNTLAITLFGDAGADIQTLGEDHPDSTQRPIYRGMWEGYTRATALCRSGRAKWGDLSGTAIREELRFFDANSFFGLGFQLGLIVGTLTQGCPFFTEDEIKGLLCSEFFMFRDPEWPNVAPFAKEAVMA